MTDNDIERVAQEVAARIPLAAPRKKMAPIWRELAVLLPLLAAMGGLIWFMLVELNVIDGPRFEHSGPSECRK